MAKFNFIETGLRGCKVIEPTVFGDDRGYFMETFQAEAFAQAGLPTAYVQDNQSKSAAGVLRGLHFQKQHPQGKLVRVVRGAVFDVAVDLRPRSETFGKWFGIELTEQNKKQLFVPEGMAHGFLVLSDEAEFVYKCTALYDPTDEGGIPYDDADIGIVWPAVEAGHLCSEKDRRHPAFSAQTYEFFDRW